MSDGHDSLQPKDIVFVPLGVVATLKDAVSAVVGDDGIAGAVGSLARRGRAEVDVRRGQLETLIGLARSLGSRGATPDAEEAAPAVTRTVVARPASAPAGANADTVVAADVVTEVVAAVPTPAPDVELPIADYDTLSATQIAQRLTGLQPDELLAVKAYEDANRKRRTIIGRIDALVAAADD